MSKTLYKIRSRADKNHTAEADWQNASELVAHGFWEWADGGNGGKQFAKAKKLARTVNTPPQGFNDPEGDDDNADDGDDEPEIVEKPAKLTKKPIKVEEVAAVVPVKGEKTDPLADMTRDELMAEATKLGLSPDSRLGTKNLVALIRETLEAGE